MTEAFSLTCWDGGKGPGTFIGTLQVSKNKWSKSQKLQLGLLILCRDRFIILYIYTRQFSMYSDGLGTFTSISIPSTIPTCCGAHWNGRGSQEGRERKSRKSQPSSGSVPGQPGQPSGTIAMLVITRGYSSIIFIYFPFTRPGKQTVCDMENGPVEIVSFPH